MPVKKNASTKRKTVEMQKGGTVKKANEPPRRIKAVKDPYTKTALLTRIAENTGLTKTQVSAVFDELRDTVEGHVKKGGAQVFTLPGLLKVKIVRKPATKARNGINPFTGEETVFKAKPAHNVVKILPLKALKDMAA